MHEPWQTGTQQALAAVEARQLRRILPWLIGYHLLQIGPWAYRADCLDKAPRRYGCVAAAADEDGDADLCFDGCNLPIASHCMDIVFLPHSLERCAAPRQLLREADRVLCDRGQLVLTGFNPLHPLMWLRHGLASSGGQDKGVGLYTARRVCDWLELLDFEIVHHRRYGLGFPYLPLDGIDGQASLFRRWPAVFSQAYMLVARKQIVSMTPVRWSRRQRARFATPSATAATTRLGSKWEIA